MTVGIPTEKDVDATIDADVAVNVNYADMVVADVYYATKTMLGYSVDEKTNSYDGSDDIDTYAVELDYEKFGSGPIVLNGLGRGFIGFSAEDYLSAKVAFDMNAFDVPVKLTLAAMDVANNPYFDLEAYAEVAGFEITGFGGYQFVEGFGGPYDVNNFHFGAKVAYTIEPVGKISAATTFMTMIPDFKDAEAQNAMSLEIGLENTTLVSGATLKAGYKTANLIDDNMYIAQTKGEVYVSATIEF